MEDLEIEDEGFLIEDYIGKNVYTIGSPGGTVFSSSYFEGNLDSVAKDPSAHILNIRYDCSFLFPLENEHTGEFEYEGRRFEYKHIIKKRGEQEFSSLDTLRLARFSNMIIRAPVTPGDIIILENGYPIFNISDYSWKVLNYLNSKINNAIENKKHVIDLDANRILSYRILYIKVKNLPEPTVIAITTYPYTSPIEIDAPQKGDAIDESLLRLYLENKVALVQFAKNYIPKVENSKDFEDICFRIVHDFSYYILERPEAFYQLSEEMIRDLFLVTLKMIFPYSESEAFHYDGKLDFKVIDPLNKYDVISGEFKIWSGKSSFEECLEQIVSKHSNGSEKEVYMLFINKNKDVKSTYTNALKFLKESPNYIEEINPNISLARNQFFSKHRVFIKLQQIPLVLGIINVFHERVKI